MSFRRRCDPWRVTDGCLLTQRVAGGLPRSAHPVAAGQRRHRPAWDTGAARGDGRIGRRSRTATGAALRSRGGSDSIGPRRPRSRSLRSRQQSRRPGTGLRDHVHTTRCHGRTGALARAPALRPSRLHGCRPRTGHSRRGLGRCRRRRRGRRGSARPARRRRLGLTGRRCRRLRLGGRRGRLLRPAARLRPGSRRTPACRRGTTRRQQAQRVDISLGLRGHPDAEMDVGTTPFRRAARPRAGHGHRFGHRVALPHAEFSQVAERDREPVSRQDRDRLAMRRDGAGKGHRAARRRENRFACLGADVDAAMLPRRVGVSAEGEGLEHLAVRRPGPCEHGSRCCEGAQPGARHHEYGHPATPHLDVLLISSPPDLLGSLLEWTTGSQE